jgi:hypothetical protein
VDPIPDQLLLRKSGSAGNLNWDLWICDQELWPLDHRDDQRVNITWNNFSYHFRWIDSTLYHLFGLDKWLHGLWAARLVCQEEVHFSSPRNPDWLRGLRSLLSSGHRGFFPSWVVRDRELASPVFIYLFVLTDAEVFVYPRYCSFARCWWWYDAVQSHALVPAHTSYQLWSISNDSRRNMYKFDSCL